MAALRKLLIISVVLGAGGPARAADYPKTPSTRTNGKETLYSPREWKSRMRFHSDGPRKIKCKLHIKALVTRLFKRKTPILLVDLDDTAYPLQHRTHQIFREWIGSKVSDPFPEARGILAQLSPDRIGYGPTDTLPSHGIEKESAAYSSIMAFWRERFFQGEYLQYDKPYEGAPQFFRKLHTPFSGNGLLHRLLNRLFGIKIAYLTGRPKETMQRQTVANLARDGFPVPGERNVDLVMTPEKRRFKKDSKFKQKEALRYPNANEAVIGYVENEPVNMACMAEALNPKDVMEIFVDSTSSENAAHLVPDTFYRLTGYR